MPVRHSTYGPYQLAGLLGLTQRQLDRASEMGLIPPPRADAGRWAAAVVDELLARRDEIRQAVGADQPPRD